MTLASVDAARAAILAGTDRLGVREVQLADADGLWLAQDVVAGRDQPPFDASAMDGWAVQSPDARPGVKLTVISESAAGHAPDAIVGPGEAARIFTGASLPPGADRIIIQEEAERRGDDLFLGGAISQASWIRRRGGDFRKGDVLLRAGVRLNPWRLALAAAAGLAVLVCARPVRVAILPTGDEVVPAGGLAGPFQIFDAAGPGLLALVRRWGADPVLLPPARDDKFALAKVMRSLDHDLVVTVGGASVGDHDLVKPVARALGAHLLVDGVAVRPGRPLWFGILPDDRRVLGLPGNPVSALVCAELFLAPLLAALQGGAADLSFEPASLVGSLEANGPREHYMRGRLCRDEGGHRVEPSTAQDSSLVGVLASSNALIRRAPFASEAVDGDAVEVLSGSALAGGAQP